MARGIHGGSRCRAVALAALLGSCTGPVTYLDNPGGHRCFIDGTATTKTQLPFRYYGTTRCDTEPADVGGRPDFDNRPASRTATLSPPASPWLFPLDFVAELAHRTFAGRDDLVLPVIVEPSPTAERIAPGAPPSLVDFADRALQARASR